MENATVQEIGSAQAENGSILTKEQVAVADCRIVSFFLADKGYAFDIMRVKEIVKAGHFTYVPNTAPFVLGVYNLRGDIIPILDLRLFFNLPVEPRTSDALDNMIVLTIDEQNYGVVVDSISKVVSIYSGSIQPPHPIFGDINSRYIQGVVENEGKLYILLDAERIFREKELNAEHDVSIAQESFAAAPVAEGSASVAAAPAPVSATAPAPVAEEPKQASVSADKELSFIRDSLAVMSHFQMSQINEDWVNARFEEWASLRGAENLQLHTEEDASLFLSTFSSPCSGALWSDQYMSAVSAILPDNSARQINVWDIGCGKGFEAYSIAVMLKERYPSARIRIYANDMDLLSISSAPLLAIPDENVPSRIKPYLIQNVSGGQVFNQEIRDMVLFEYHDCSNQNSLPALDFVVCRDTLSFLDSKKQSSIIYDISENLKNSGVVLLGANEAMPKNAGWKKKTKGNVSVFAKE